MDGDRFREIDIISLEKKKKSCVMLMEVQWLLVKWYKGKHILIFLSFSAYLLQRVRRESRPFESERTNKIHSSSSSLHLNSSHGTIRIYQSDHSLPITTTDAVISWTSIDITMFFHGQYITITTITYNFISDIWAGDIKSKRSDQYHKGGNGQRLRVFTCRSRGHRFK